MQWKRICYLFMSSGKQNRPNVYYVLTSLCPSPQKNIQPLTVTSFSHNCKELCEGNLHPLHILPPALKAANSIWSSVWENLKGMVAILGQNYTRFVRLSGLIERFKPKPHSRAITFILVVQSCRHFIPSHFLFRYVEDFPNSCVCVCSSVFCFAACSPFSYRACPFL